MTWRNQENAREARDGAVQSSRIDKSQQALKSPLHREMPQPEGVGAICQRGVSVSSLDMSMMIDQVETREKSSKGFTKRPSLHD